MTDSMVSPEPQKAPMAERLIDGDISVLADLVGPFRGLNERLTSLLTRLDGTAVAEQPPAGSTSVDSASYHDRLRHVIGALRGVQEESFGLLENIEKLV